MLSNPDSSEDLCTSDCKADDELTTQTGSEGNLTSVQSGPDSDLDKGMRNLSLNSIETQADIHTRRKSSAPFDLKTLKQDSSDQKPKPKLPNKEIQSQSSISSMDSVNTGAKPKLKKKRSGSSGSAPITTSSKTIKDARE